jgi:hypothetical protein
MAKSGSSEQPSWQRNPVFQFFASLKLAVVLLAVLIVAAIAGTLYESSFDAKVARAYVYGAPWFNFWLVLLAANLTVSALSRWPWRKHHAAFLITHLGIITLLAGSLIGRIWGIEGTITLFKGDPPTNRLLVDQRQLRVRDVDGTVKAFSAEFLHHPPTPRHPRDLGTLASGAHLRVVDYSPAINATLDPKPLTSGGTPAVHFTIKTAAMGQQLESWLLADNAGHDSFSMGLADIELKRGVAPPVSNSGGNVSSPQSEARAGKAIDLEESMFAFSKAPNERIAYASKGGSTGARITLEQPTNGGKGRLLVSLGGKETSLDVGQNLGRDIQIEGTSFTLRIDNYWPDFQIHNGHPSSLTTEPNNPAVLVTIRGKGVPVEAPPVHDTGAGLNANGGPPAMPPAGGKTPDHLTLFIADHGTITYELVSRRLGRSSGKLEIDKPLTTGWADWKLKVDRVLPHAEQWMDFTPVTSDQATSPGAADLPDGLRLHVQQNGRTFDQWVPAGWRVSVPTVPVQTTVTYGFKTISLPIGLELMNFEVKRNEGSDSPAGFKSTLRVSTMDGGAVIGSCWMNHPFSFPSGWIHTWTGLTYKISQASWNPDNLGQSSVQILRDPGWLLKWIGSLLIVIGVFMMFYLRPYRKQTAGEPITPSGVKSKKRKPEPVMA